MPSAHASNISKTSMYHMENTQSYLTKRVICVCLSSMAMPLTQVCLICPKEGCLRTYLSQIKDIDPQVKELHPCSYTQTKPRSMVQKAKSINKTNNWKHIATSQHITTLHIHPSKAWKSRALIDRSKSSSYKSKNKKLRKVKTRHIFTKGTKQNQIII